MDRRPHERHGRPARRRAPIDLLVAAVAATSLAIVPAFYLLRVLSLTDLSLLAAGRCRRRCARSSIAGARGRARAAVVDHRDRARSRPSCSSTSPTRSPTSSSTRRKTTSTTSRRPRATATSSSITFAEKPHGRRASRRQPLSAGDHSATPAPAPAPTPRPRCSSRTASTPTATCRAW